MTRDCNGSNERQKGMIWDNEGGNAGQKGC